MINKNFFDNTDFNACQILKILRDTTKYYPNCSTLEQVSYHAFNEDYKYIYNEDAERALQVAGVFDCFKVVHDYLMEVDGEDNTDYSDPVNVANTLFYIQGEKVTQAVADWIGVSIDDDLNNKNWNKLLCANIKNLIPFLDDFHSFKEQE